MILMAFFIVIAIIAVIGCIKSKKPAIKIWLGILATVFVFISILLGSLTYVIRYKIHDIDTSLSSDGKYELILQQVGDPDWPFGSTHARVVLKNGNNVIKKYKFDVHNDGANITDSSWVVDWNDNSVAWIIYAEEQSDQSYHIFFDGTTFSKSLDTHYGVKYESQKKEKTKNSNQVVEEDYLLDEEGYPMDDEWQSYKEELLKIASNIYNNSDSDIKCCISAKGYPYAVLEREINENTGEKVEYHLIFNESYEDSSKHEYVLEEYAYSSNGEEAASPTIIDFYLIDCETLEVTDEQTNTWH